MEGFILAAGLGTRLRPLTNDRPKALVEVQGRTLLDICIHRLAATGVEHCVVNVHHYATMVKSYLEQRQWPCRITVSDESELLLDTGGALRKAAPLFSGRETVLVHNVDVLTGIDLRAMVAEHEAAGNLATLCASHRHTARALQFDAEGRLMGRAEGEVSGKLAFSGIAAVSPALFDLLPEADHPYPIIDEYIRLSHAGHRIVRWQHAAEQWLDVGRPETLAQAEEFLSKNKPDIQ